MNFYDSIVSIVFMSKSKLRIATRKSPLALWQARHIKNCLLKKWPNLEIELVPMITSGDRFLKDKLQEKGGKGLFVKELETALLNDEADIAVHSMKDVPSHLPSGLCISTIFKRDNPYDALVSPQWSSLDALPLNAVIGTSSLRRQAQLLRYRPDLKVKLLRGNINTRIEKLDEGLYDAILLAVSGLQRMGMHERIQQIIPQNIMLPACAQGALGIECRTDDAFTQNLLAPLHDEETAVCVLAEREVNRRLGGHCHVPIAIFSEWIKPQDISLEARILNPDGSVMIESQEKGRSSQWTTIAQKVAHDLIEMGGEDLIKTSLQ